jgi:hypothetical protein
MKKLPIGRQHFASIIREDLLYIDKTRQIYEMIEAGNLYFFSRPRRFGKSLLISTLKEIFSGNRELFKDLYIGKKTNYDWKIFPVLSFNFATLETDAALFEESLQDQLALQAKTFHLKLTARGLKAQLTELVTTIAQQHGQVVFLIDEYDKPLVDYFTEPEKASKNRAILRKFFSPLKDLDANGHLRFLFITGVSKFSKISLFSDLNNLTDLTIHPLSMDLLGITQEELLHYFKPYIPVSAQSLEMPKARMLKGVQLWYDGYSYDGKTFLYNPFSLLNFFAQSQFRNFWFSSGTPTFLVETIRDNGILPEAIETKEVPDTFFEKFDMEQLDLHGLLFQTGYLTIKRKKQIGFQSFYALGYPNEEVRQAFNHNLLEAFTHKVSSTVSPALLYIYEALQEGNVAQFIDQLKILLADISYHLHPRVKKNASQKEKANAFSAWEGYFHTIVYLICTFLNLYVETETTKHKGRLDLLVQTDEFLYLIEFKLDESAEDAIAQIKSRAYAQSYKNSKKRILLVGVGFSQKEKNVETWEVEEWEK